MSEDKLRTELALCVRMLEYLGLIDYSGHVSCRIPGMDAFFINSWGASRHGLGPADIVRADMDGNSLDEGAILPSEKYIHTSVYQFRPDINAIAHLHPPVTTALSAAGKEYIPVMHHGAIFHAGVSVYDNCSHVNTSEKGNAVAETLGPRRAMIIRGHGAVVVAESVRGVFFGSVYLEDNAKKLSDAYMMGGKPQALREDELQECKKVWRQNQFDKIWNYYEETSGVKFS
jgi:ribulose-5-phosphate 4-epimerase/fuculose-1-phosphate aldolase